MLVVALVTHRGLGIFVRILWCSHWLTLNCHVFESWVGNVKYLRLLYPTKDGFTVSPSQIHAAHGHGPTQKNQPQNFRKNHYTVYRLLYRTMYYVMFSMYTETRNTVEGFHEGRTPTAAK